ncbi:hypothetical protein FRX31_005607 [Thalictrum thalictroides]|uniref:FBD domain-containing protein n=1 Tax=Thalictrum thalictroides TaxID=46969 RepID=A0A7J6X6V7_THATH|nr:hypothetical protein FRX31_005607 [Thalictrum thalictroides]
MTDQLGILFLLCQKHLKSSTKEEEEWGNQFVTREIFGKLKSVEIKGIEGSEDELKFLEFVLQKAFVLEKITITATSATMAPSTDVLDELAEFNEKIGQFPRASSSVAIVSKLS